MGARGHAANANKLLDELHTKKLLLSTLATELENAQAELVGERKRTAHQTDEDGGRKTR
jgi:hypothetical protein